VNTSSSFVEIIQDSVDFVDGNTLSKYGIDPTSIENVFDKEVLGGMMENVLMIISRNMRPKLMCTKVDEEVPIPGVIRGDEEEVFIGEIIIDWGIISVREKIRNDFGWDEIFLSFGNREI
jgi:hypothetical protein